MNSEPAPGSDLPPEPKLDLSIEKTKCSYRYDEWGRMIIIYRDRVTDAIVYETPPTGKKRRWRTRR